MSDFRLGRVIRKEAVNDKQGGGHPPEYSLYSSIGKDALFLLVCTDILERAIREEDFLGAVGVVLLALPIAKLEHFSSAGLPTIHVDE